jgi:hypothetical protein
MESSRDEYDRMRRNLECESVILTIMIDSQFHPDTLVLGWNDMKLLGPEIYPG